MEDVLLVRYGNNTIIDNGGNEIEGYNLFLILGATSVVSVILIKKRHRSTFLNPIISIIFFNLTFFFIL